MSTIEARLAELHVTIQSPGAPAGSYVPAVRTGNLVYLSGQIPKVGGQMLASGAVPSKVSVEKAQECARACVVNALAVLKAELGDLDRIRRIVRVGVFVCSDPGFTDQPKVGNGASDFLVSVFGERGKHARAAVGSVALPLGAPVEVEMIVEVE